MFKRLNILAYLNDFINKNIKRRKAISFYKIFIKPGDLCFDIGANIGDKVELFRQLDAKVIAVEPQPLCAGKIRDRFSDDSNVDILNDAIGSKQGVDEMYVCSDINVLSTMSKKWLNQSRFSTNKKVTWDSKIDVSVITLDDLINKYGVPKFCKVDVEGFELEVFSGLTKKMQYLSFEFMKEFLDDSLRICSILEKIGNFKANYSLYENLDQKVFFQRGWRPCSDVIQELRSIDDKKLWGDIYIKFE